MTDKIFHRIRKYGEDSGIAPLYSSAEGVIVGFSGGADSSLLLSYFLRLRETLPDFPRVMAVHVNHCLRGAESDSDEQFCRERCRSLGAELVVVRADVPAMMAETGLGTEECARNARYRAFRDAAAGLGGGVLIATAHNADDNLETVLFDLARGGGAAGLSGIPPVRGTDWGGTVIRPLLGLESGEIRELCAGEGIPYVTDSTNADEGYTRNFIRRSVAPLMRQVNPAVCQSALRCGVSLREDEEYFREAAAAAVGAYLPDCRTDLAEVPRDVLAALPMPVMARAVVLLGAAVTDVAMSAEQIRLCRRLIAEKGTGAVSLPDSVTLEVSKTLVTVSRAVRAPEPFSFTAELPAEGECLRYSCREAGFDLFFARDKALLPNVSENIYKLSIHTALRFDTIYGKVSVRQRMPGDTLQLGGHTRRLKKMICDRGIPESIRGRLPVICDGGGVLLVPGLPVRGDAYYNEADPANGGALHVLYCLYRSLV